MKPILNEVSAGAIIFRRRENILEFLLLEGHNGNFGFPKGHLIANDLVINAKREVLEETGIAIDFLPSFHEKFTYTHEFPKDISEKTVHLFLGQCDSNVKISNEHKSFVWGTFEESLDKLVFNEQRNCLKKANALLSRS